MVDSLSISALASQHVEISISPIGPRFNWEVFPLSQLLILPFELVFATVWRALFLRLQVFGGLAFDMPCLLCNDTRILH